MGKTSIKDKHYFHSGDDVVHVDPVNDNHVSMTVSKVVFKHYKTINRETEQEEVRKKVTHVECYFWTSDGQGGLMYVKEMFHPRKLVPWGIFAQGTDEWQKWLAIQSSIYV